MASPLVETKLYPPKLRRSLVARPRLSGRLRRGAESRLTLVPAPAGFGKSTLLAEWLAASDGKRSVAWLSLEESDSQPASYWTYLITALQTVVPGVGTSALPLLQSGQPPIETVLTAVLNELSAVPDDSWLVLDDYHLVDGPEIQAGMTFLLEHLPPQVHLVVSTREDPALPLARLRAGGELVEIRAADLRFTLDEVAAYLNDVTGLDLAPATSRPWRDAPKAGSPRSSWPPCPCRDETTSPASSPASPGTTGTSSTTSSKRSWDGNQPTSAAFWSRRPSLTG